MAVDKLTPHQIEQLVGWKGECNAMAAEHIVTGADFTLLDIQRLTDEYYHGRVGDYLHMSDSYEGDIVNKPENVKGWICFRSLEEVGNRRLADKLSKNCKEVLGSDKKCEALKAVVEKYAEESTWWTVTKWTLGGIAGIVSGVAIFFVIGPAIAKKIYGKKPPDDHDGSPPVKPGLPTGMPDSENSTDTSASKMVIGAESFAKGFLADAATLQLLGGSGVLNVPRVPIAQVPKMNIGRVAFPRLGMARGAGGIVGALLTIGLRGPQGIADDMDAMVRSMRYRECQGNPSSACRMEFGPGIGML